MLVITRYPEQSVIIGDNIKLVVKGINGKQVKLGIEAPSDVPIVRDELLKPAQKAVKSSLKALSPLR